MTEPVVAIALSGGVDSLVAGFLIKKAYKKVLGIHFTTGYEKLPTPIHSIENQLGLPVHTIDLSDSFEEKVVQYFMATYLEGKTPNPCLICNQQIKFGVLLEKAGELGADVIATGHYATIVNSLSFPDKTILHPWLEKGADPLKDQSYFLSLLSADQLERIIFPLAGFTKSRVRALAKENNLMPISPAESQDICFIQDTSFSQFIIAKKQISPKQGSIKDMTGKIVGIHKGLHAFTIGQRRGIDCPASEPYYVRHIDLSTNTLVVCFKKDLAQTQMLVDKIIWNYPSTTKGTETMEVTTKIRYSHKGAASRLVRNGAKGQVRFDEPQFSITPGQAAVFYQENRVLGAGIIQ
ncbi:MAG: tRNA 2-thiouridine(34) synthase MnmA [Proteobacteria bacterium]|nr:tRNA 2-thiouridine(34) synthase MnmA [Desulfobacula sp.]MBU3954771.1 tRNA 2-thiouridine(34) synthase MnmA [Pseudomonadota bacterium]MBU4132739.1 tRNA 2-thiouridine(34) synthase MnmA [Pseudomonadota bacterium]